MLFDVMQIEQRPSEFWEEYNKRSELPRYQDYATLTFFGVAYDAMWAMAVGLHNAAVRISNGDDSGCDDKPGQITPLEEFEYFNQKMGCILRRAFEQIHFPGITVSVAVFQVLVKCFKPDGNFRVIFTLMLMAVALMKLLLLNNTGRMVRY